MEELSRLQQRFTSDVSHELRTPLTTLKGYAEALADGVIGPEGAQRAGATMLARSLNKLEHQDFGYQVQKRVLVALQNPPSSYAPPKLAALYRQLEEHLDRLPGVRRCFSPQRLQAVMLLLSVVLFYLVVRSTVPAWFLYERIRWPTKDRKP